MFQLLKLNFLGIYFDIFVYYWKNTPKLTIYIYYAMYFDSFQCDMFYGVIDFHKLVI